MSSQPLRYLGPLLALFLPTACGGTTTVTVQLTDAPPDVSAIEHVSVSLEHVDVHVAGADAAGDDGAAPAGSEHGSADDESAGSGDGSSRDGGGWRTVTAKAGTFDLVALQNDVRATLGELELPDGKITQIRLFIDPAGKNEVELANGDTCALDLSRVPPTGIKIIHPFKALDVTDSSKLTLVVDFDLAQSLDQSGACAFALDPVIDLKHVERD